MERVFQVGQVSYAHTPNIPGQMFLEMGVCLPCNTIVPTAKPNHYSSALSTVSHQAPLLPSPMEHSYRSWVGQRCNNQDFATLPLACYSVKSRSMNVYTCKALWYLSKF